MLVLTREPNQTICIGDDITVTVLQVRGGKVRLGIEAPPEVAVDRYEVRQAIKRERGRFSKPQTNGGPER